MLERSQSGQDLDKFGGEIIRGISQSYGSPIDVTKYTASENTYSLEVEGFDALVLTINHNEIIIRNIEATNPGRGEGRRMIEGLIEVAKDTGVELIAEDVGAGKDQDSRSFWSALGFVPKNEDSADYVYDK